MIKARIKCILCLFKSPMLPSNVATVIPTTVPPMGDTSIDPMTPSWLFPIKLNAAIKEASVTFVRYLPSIDRLDMISGLDAIISELILDWNDDIDLESIINYEIFIIYKSKKKWIIYTKNEDNRILKD